MVCRIVYMVSRMVLVMNLVLVSLVSTADNNRTSDNVQLTRRTPTAHRNIAGMNTSFYNPYLHKLVSHGKSGSYHTIGIFYTRFIDKHWSVSFSGTILEGEIFNYYKNGRYYNDWTSYSGLSLSGKSHFHVVHKRNWSIYSGAGLGYLIAEETDVPQLNNGLTFQVDIIGYQRSFLWEHLGLNAQLGFGIEGVVQVGIRYSW